MDEDFNRAAIEAINAAKGDPAREREEWIVRSIHRMYDLGEELYRELRERNLAPTHVVFGRRPEQCAVWGLYGDNEITYEPAPHQFVLDAHGRFLLRFHRGHAKIGPSWEEYLPISRDELLHPGPDVGGGHSHDYGNVYYSRHQAGIVVSHIEFMLEEIRDNRSWLQHR